MKIAFASDSYWPRVNGVTVSIDSFLSELRARGHEVRLWAPEYPLAVDRDKPHQHDPGVYRLKSFPMVGSKEDRLPRLTQRRLFFTQLDELRPDLLHVHTEFIQLLVKSYARKHRLPVVQTCHTYFEQYMKFYFPLFPTRWLKALARLLTRMAFHGADTIIAPTVPMKAVLESYGIKTPIVIVPTGIPQQEFQGLDRAEERRSSRWLDLHPELRGRRILLAVGRVAQEKNVDFLLDVLERVRVSQPQSMLVVAGNGPYFEEFRRNIGERGLSPHVLLLGYVERADLRHLYTLADVFTFASVTETQGLVTAEAMMCGTPAVAIGKMGTKEFMAGDNGGFMVDEDLDAFSGAVLRLLGDEALYHAKSAEAQAYAALWSAEAMAVKLESVYQGVLREHRSRLDFSAPRG